MDEAQAKSEWLIKALICRYRLAVCAERLLRSAEMCGILREVNSQGGRMEKVNVTCRLDADDVAFLDKLAETTDRDRSYLIKQAVAEFISLQKWQIEEIEAAIVEADAGKFLSDAELRKLFKELRG
jgi:predicted transcriptional regulator